ncbi:MAG: C40 family peptidase [Armatimonadota bacterium]
MSYKKNLSVILAGTSWFLLFAVTSVLGEPAVSESTEPGIQMAAQISSTPEPSTDIPAVQSDKSPVEFETKSAPVPDTQPKEAEPAPQPASNDISTETPSQSVSTDKGAVSDKAPQPKKVQSIQKSAVKPKTAKAVVEPKKTTAVAQTELKFDLTPKAATTVANGSAEPGFISRFITASKSLIGKALSWLGTRYVWGGISTRGVDCSGLTKLLYQKEGIKLPHSAKQQFKLGKPVKSPNLAPGDLVFFNTRGPISHVGMYIGEGKFVHAANRRRGVRVDSLNAAYYSKRFAGARRYLNFS